MLSRGATIAIIVVVIVIVVGSIAAGVGYAMLPQWVQNANGSICNRSCGGGTQTTQVQCVDFQGNVVSDDQCAMWHKKPSPITNVCNTQACRWISSKEPCSKTCGHETVAQNVACETGSDADCASTPRPASTVTCNIPMCKWNLTQWTSCSATGQATRTPQCQTATGGIVDESDCVTADRPTLDLTRSCFPSGTVIAWSQAAIPAGWEEYAPLQNRYLRCNNYATKSSGGRSSITLTTSQIPSHTHEITIARGGGWVDSGSNNAMGVTSDVAFTDTVPTSSTGSNGSIGLQPPCIVLKYIRKQ